MPKKDTAAVVLGMLSSAGAQTRRDPEGAVAAEQDTAPATVTVTKEAAAPVRSLPAPPPSRVTSGADAPRTLRLRSATAQRLRQAWLEAKRDDVLLTAQDFASDLVDQALARRRRSAAQT